jgi:ectoine hydroxylase-related dioxygenase (phytanoyl-CoA dioxygenase family)
LDEQGFAVVPGIMPPKLVDQLIEHIKGALSKRTGNFPYAMRLLANVVPIVQQLAKSAAVRSLFEPVLGPDAFMVRSLFFDKMPDANWKVAWHQDLTIAVREKIETSGFCAWSVKDGVVHVQPPVALLERMLTVRLHLDHCDSANGPLQVISGSHKSGRLSAEGISAWRKRRQPVTCKVPRGGALLMRPLLLHASSAATDPKHRRVIHLEFAAEPLPGGLKWL